MAQATNILSFPSKKLTFEPLDLDAERFLKAYDRDRVFMDLAISILTKTPKQLKMSVKAMRQSDIIEECAEKLVLDLDEVSRDFGALSEMLSMAAERLTAASRNLI